MLNVGNITHYLNDSSAEMRRKISVTVSSLTPRINRTRSKSFSHVSSKYESLDYDIWENEVLIKEEQRKNFDQIIRINIFRWFLYFVIGLITGLTALFVDTSINFFINIKNEFLQNYLNKCFINSCLYLVSVMWCFVVILPGLVGSFIVIFIEPNASGSGIPSIISYLNGVRIPNFANVKILITKILSVIFCCVAGFAAGKEGPFIHIGSAISNIVSSNQFTKNVFFSFGKIFYPYTVQERRDLMAGGFAAGVSAAFGSPVGATLMSLEEGTSFWSVILMWRIFFCAIISCFTFNTTLNLTSGNSEQKTYMGLFYFGKFNETVINYDYFELPLFFGIGVIGGLMGALFIFIHLKTAVFRKKYVYSRYLQVVDSLVISFLTAFFGIFSIYLFCFCNNTNINVIGSETIHSVQMSCAEGYYNEMSLFWFQTQESILRLLFHGPPDLFHLKTLSMFFLLYFILLSLTTGSSISAGIFIPNLLLGATWGRIIGVTVFTLFPHVSWTIPAKCALLGAVAQLGGVLRITISLTVVIIEATGTLTFGFPLMLTLFTTKWVGDFFIEGMYESQINLLGIPILPTEPPPLTSDITAEDLMNMKVIAFPMIVSVDYLLKILNAVSHHGFPVVKEITETKSVIGKIKAYGELRGFILRSQLITLLATKSFTVPVSAQDFHKMFELFQKNEFSLISLQNLNFNPEERSYLIDLRPYMNSSPYSIQIVMSFPRIFRLFRSLGLRHVIVINTKNQVVGIITRKDLAKLRLWRCAISMGLKELRVQ